jgi:hypothetical protein
MNANRHESEKETATKGAKHTNEERTPFSAGKRAPGTPAQSGNRLRKLVCEERLHGWASLCASGAQLLPALVRIRVY